MLEGWIKLHRKIEDNDLWFSEPFTKAQAWIDLVLFANHQDGSFWIRGVEIKLKRGQIGWSELTMMKRWSWSRDKVRRFLRMLKTRQQIRQEILAKITTIITIVNYDQYQDDTTDNTIKRQQKDNRRYTNKNEKNEKNEKNILSPVGDGEEFNFKGQVKKMSESKDKRMNIIAYYWVIKGFKFPTRQAYETALRRELRAAGSIVGYENDQIKATIAWLKDNADFKWTLETVHKYIDEPLENLAKGGKPITEEERIKKLLES